MSSRAKTLWIHRPEVKEVLLSFCIPRTPKQVERELGATKLKLSEFLKKNSIMPLNPTARKGRLYIVTSWVREQYGLLAFSYNRNTDWDVIGWLLSSPRQRLALLQTISLDCKKRTSEEIRTRGSRLNPHFTRISTKTTLNELVKKSLIETDLFERKRYYWINQNGASVADFIKANLKINVANLLNMHNLT